ncbi:MAG: hypothetical protein HOI07_04340 [Betaproteobacteria bacterium]|jgi:hypothetical protein|nr:hypothetical protein [Betaproteobacteria bacterium]
MAPQKRLTTMYLYVGLFVIIAGVVLRSPLLSIIRKKTSEKYSYGSKAPNQSGKKVFVESPASKARRKAKKCKYLSSPSARKKAGC